MNLVLDGLGESLLVTGGLGGIGGNVVAWAIPSYYQAAEVIDTTDIWEVGNAVEVLR